MTLVPLTHPAARRQALVGGKVAGLARLVAHGLPVPPGVAVPVNAFRAFLKHHGLARSARQAAAHPDPERAAALQAAIRAAPLPPALAGALREATAPLGPLLAVRSSAAEEDGRSASYAGMYRSALGVAPGDALEAAIRDCWASAFEPAALVYRRRAGGAPRMPAMALLVQAMVPARAAGVAFTVNAMTGSHREMVVEAAWGLGEAVVAGRVVPDHYRVRRPRRLPGPLQRVAARLRLEVLEEAVQDQPERLVLAPGGAAWEPVPEALRMRPRLPRETLLELCRLALRAESLAGTPQDVEWAVGEDGAIRLLQSRPITVGTATLRQADVLWTRRFIGERWSEPATPLGWSLVQPLLEHFIAYPGTARRHLGGGPPLRLVQGAPYMNATVFRHLAFKLPGLPPPRFMMDMLPPEEEREWLARFAAPPDARVYASILLETLIQRRWRRFRWNPLTNHRAWDALERRLEREIPRLLDPPPEGPREALERANRGMALARDYVKVHVTSLLFANLLYQLVAGFLELWLGPGGATLVREILRAPEGNLTVATHHDLWVLAREARRTGADLAAPPAEDHPFHEPFHAFMRQHGHRSDATWEVMADRWAERPERVLGLVRQVLEAGERDPAEVAREQARATERALEELRVRVTHPVRRRVLLEAVRLTRRYLLLRENQRYHFDRLLFSVKQAYLAVGRAWVREGALAAPEDIRFLEVDEVAAAVARPRTVRTLRRRVEERRRLHEAWRQACPPDFLVGNEPVGLPRNGGRRFAGLGTSPGVVRGHVRILKDLGEASRLRKGEVLVTRATDPGWTPLFLVAGAIVLELGSQLSHGAVVAREYGVPMVVNVPGATRLLQDGQEVVVDGTRGAVWVRD